MKKIKYIPIAFTAVALAWTVGALGYFMIVAHHFSSVERKENANKTDDSQRTSNTRGGRHSANHPVYRDYGNKQLGDHIKRTAREYYGPKVVQREATGRFNGSKLFRPT